MDEDSDVDRELDNSLVDLHHGLDSSTEDNRVENNIGCHQDVYVGNGTQPVNLPAQHVNMLEDMVQEMRQGLQAAVEELAKLQVREDGERDKQIQQQQQRQLDDLTENVNDLKNQMNSMTKCLETIQRETTKMRDDYASLTKYVKDTKGDAMTHLSDRSFEWNEKLPENPFDGGDEEEVVYRDASNKDKNDDEVTAVACKSLSLTQALGEKCLHLNLSMSSDEGEDLEMRRLSHFNPATTNGGTHKNDETSRRHSLPASTTPRGNNSSNHVTNAAQRRKAVKELTDSECDYCSQLWTLIETYCASLQNAGFLGHDQLEVLFPSYLEKLYEQHCVIYSNLQDKLVHWSYLTVVSDLLSCITDTHNPYSLLSLYREYSENLPDAVSCLRSALTHSTELKALLKTIQQSSYQNDDLMTLIKAPAQHLPKYLLQLQQICKYTPSTHPDYLLLRTSLSRLRLFVEQMNIGINNAMQTTSRDFRPGSSNDSSQLLSARDSGNISNEDDLLSARTLFKSEQCLLSEELQDPYHLSVHNNPATPNSFYGRQSRGVPRPKNSNLNTLSHPDLSRINSPVPGSAPFSLPPTGLVPGWRAGVEGRQATKNKHQMKRMPLQPAQFSHLDHNNHLSTSRPSSAIDFTNGYNTAYPVHHYPDTNYPRPRSALGPLDSHHRPAIISRKHMRRSQPPMSNSSYWADIDSQHTKHSQQRMSFSPHELLPSRPAPLFPYNSQEDDEEDDTRASDSFSCLTSSSHQHSSGRGSNIGNDIDLEFHPLASEPSPVNLRGCKKYSEDDVAVRLAQELLSDDDDQKDLDNFEDQDEINDKKVLQAAENINYRQRVSESRAKKNESEKKTRVPKQQPSRSKLETKRDQSSDKLLNSDRNGEFEKSTDETSCVNSIDKEAPVLLQKRQTYDDSRMSKEYKDHREPISTKDQSNHEEEDKRLKNQHFLLSLTHSPRSKKGSELNSETHDSHRNSPQSPHSRSPVPPTVDTKPQKFHPEDKSLPAQKTQPKVVRRSAPSLISNLTTGSQAPDHGPPRVASPSHLSNGSLTTDLDNSVTSGTSSQHLKSRPSSSALQTDVSSEKKTSNNIGDGDSQNLMTRSLDLSDVLNAGDSKESTYDRRKKMKNGGLDSLPKASDDPVNARKKMHLKSSLKNLFSKKRGKVILADVEREVILEMASAVVSASTSPPSVKSIPYSPPTNSENGIQMSESNSVSCNKDLSNSMVHKQVEQQGELNHKFKKIPESFEIKCKRDKGSSTASPLKVWRPMSCIQPSDNPIKSFHRLSLSPENLPQSPCMHQEKLLKERLNIQGNPDLEQKPLIHPKFLVSAKLPKDNGKECAPKVAATSHSVSTTAVSNVSNIISDSSETHALLSKEKHLQEDQGKRVKENLCKDISKYEESEKKQLKAKMKAYAHMKKHILNYEAQEADNKNKDDASKRNPDENNAKPLKHKIECPKCQNKPSDVWKYLEQTPGKSFHIQAYKAYKNKNRENVIVDKHEADALTCKDQNAQHQNKHKCGTNSSQNSIHYLKPCEEAIAFYETSRNLKMTSSYPMASQERKLKKNHLMKESGHPNHTPSDGKRCKSKERIFRDNILSLTSGVFYDNECYKPQNNSFSPGNNIPTNDLSHPTTTSISYNAIGLSKSSCYNVPASLATSNITPLPFNNLNRRQILENESCVNNIFKMSKDELFEYERNRSLPRDSKGKSELQKVITKPNSSKECVPADAPKLQKSDEQEVPNGKKQYQGGLTSDLNKDEKEPKSYCLKEERDYFDYSYRLCYVDCSKFEGDSSKFEGDSSSCANCSAEDSGIEKQAFPEHLRNGETFSSTVDRNVPPKDSGQNTCFVSVDKRLEIETKSCNEIDKWLSNLNNSTSLQHKGSELSTKPAKEKGLTTNQSVTSGKSYSIQKSDSRSYTACRGLVSSCGSSMSEMVKCKETFLPSTSSQGNRGTCALHPEGMHRPAALNRYNCRNITFETFSSSMSQPIFSVLPIEGYRVDSHLPNKYGNYGKQENQPTSQTDPHSSKSHDDAIARRALKQRVKSKEASRLSTCSIQSANEIHILKLHNLDDTPSSFEPESQAKYIQDISSHHKNCNPSTLQVRYIPKQFGSSKQNKVQTTAHAQIKRDSGCINGIAPNQPSHQSAMRFSPPKSQHPGLPATQIVQPSRDQNGIAASAVSGPDLLQVSGVHTGASNKPDPSEQTSFTPPKKQSFFSRFAHSPLSIFYKDTKNNGSK